MGKKHAASKSSLNRRWKRAWGRQQKEVEELGHQNWAKDKCIEGMLERTIRVEDKNQAQEQCIRNMHRKAKELEETNRDQKQHIDSMLEKSQALEMKNKAQELCIRNYMHQKVLALEQANRQQQQCMSSMLDKSLAQEQKIADLQKQAALQETYLKNLTSKNSYLNQEIEALKTKNKARCLCACACVYTVCAQYPVTQSFRKSEIYCFMA
jgi:hypothetical protein